MSNWQDAAQLPLARTTGTKGLGANFFRYWASAQVALNYNGNVLVVGMHQPEPGANYVFTRDGTSWYQQGGALRGDDSVNGRYGAGYGFGVSVDGDGFIFAFGAAFDNDFKGASWIFATNDAWTISASPTTARPRWPWSG